MRIGREHPLPTSAINTALVVRDPSTGTGTNTLVPPPPPTLTIMTWNLATLGGGIGYPVVRQEPVIAAIAKTIAHVKPDVCVIIEVMRHARPPIQPKFYEPRGGTPRHTFGKGTEEEENLAKLAKEVVAKLRTASLITPVTFLDVSIPIESLKDQEVFKSKDGDSFNWFRVEAAITEEYLKATQEVTNDRMIRFFDEEFAALDLTGLWNSLKPQAQAQVQHTERRDDLLKEYGVTRWWQVPGEPYVKGLEKTDAVREESRYEVAKALHNLLIEEAHQLFTRCIRQIDELPTPDQNKATLPHFDAFRRKLEFNPEEQYRRLAEFEETRKAWEKNAKISAHPGITELHRITGEICKALPFENYMCWPATDDKNTAKVNADRTGVSTTNLQTDVLYTENETYGVIFNGNAVGLERVVRLPGYAKRAPFAFRLRTNSGNVPFNVIAYHAPSSRPGNAAARTKDLEAFANAARLTAKRVDEDGTSGVATFTVGDFNVDTADRSGLISNINTTTRTSILFGELAGDADFFLSSFFDTAKTTLKRDPVLLDSGGDLTLGGREFLSLASAFDKILPYVPSCGGWALRLEMVLPFYAMLAGQDQAKKFGQAIIEDINSFKDLKVAEVVGISGALSGAEYAKPRGTGEFVALAHLIAQARLASDHLPILSVFTRPLGTGVSTLPPMTFSPPKSRPDMMEEEPKDKSKPDYNNCGGGDCIYHAVLHRQGLGDPSQLSVRIQGLRDQVADEVQNNPNRYSGFLLAHETIAGAVAAIRTMGSWNHFAGDLVPLAIANALKMNLAIHFTNTGRDTHVAPVDYTNGNLAPLNYNGYDHYW